MTITEQALTSAQVVADFTTTVPALILAQAAADITTTTVPVQLAALHITPPTTQALHITPPVTQVALVHQSNQHYSRRPEIDTSVNQKSLFYLLCIKMLISIIWLLIDC
jgi:hypothetical protein